MPLENQTERTKKIISEAGSLPDYQRMKEYLISRRSLPPIKSGFMGDGILGAFYTNTFRNGPSPTNTGEIIVHPYAAGTDTIVHETAHAADRQLENQYFEDPSRIGYIFREPSQFAQGYEKLRYNSIINGDKTIPTGNKVQDLISTLAPDFLKQNIDYRTTPKEAIAFGVESSVTGARGAGGYRAPNHIDATVATEFFILLDLAQRQQNSKAGSEGR